MILRLFPGGSSSGAETGGAVKISWVAGARGFVGGGGGIKRPGLVTGRREEIVLCLVSYVVASS